MSQKLVKKLLDQGGNDLIPVIVIDGGYHLGLDRAWQYLNRFEGVQAGPVRKFPPFGVPLGYVLHLFDQLFGNTL